MAGLFFQYLAIYDNENLPNGIIEFLAKVGSNVDKLLLNPKKITEGF